MAQSTASREVPAATRLGSAGVHPLIRAQQASTGTTRRHFSRAARRLAVLAAVDVSVLALARESLHLAREAPLTGVFVSQAFPDGFMGGAGSLAAVIIGLLFAGAYASHERWCMPSLIWQGTAIGVALAVWSSIDTQGVVWTTTRWATVTLALGLVLALARRLLTLVVFNRTLGLVPEERVLFVGDPRSEADQRAADMVLRRPQHVSVGWLSERADLTECLGHPSTVWEVLGKTRSETVVICGDVPPALFDTVVEAAAVTGCRVLSVIRHSTLTASQPRQVSREDVRMLELTFPAARAGQAAVKRVFDLLVSGTLIVAISPVLALISLLVKLDSPGPVFFVQERVGFAGRTFAMLKFRTMIDGADEKKEDLAHLNESGDSRLFKIKDDPRITRTGAFLRRWSLDELPQIINVFRGHMSLVGPRPFFESDLAAYDDHHFMRLAAKPGITGLWQVKGRSAIVDFEEVVRLDRQYIETWTFGLDIWILALTLPAVFRRNGAY